MWTVEERIQRLKLTVDEHNGQNVAGDDFAREVEDLLSAFYDDIGEIKNIRLPSLFYLFLTKTLYVERHSTDASVLDYLTVMMAEFLFTKDLFPLVRDRKRFGYLLSDMLEEMQSAARFPNLFEAYRRLGDYSLFIAGIFSASMTRRRKFNRWQGTYQPAAGVDLSYHATNGRNYYRLASNHDMAEATQQRGMLTKLANYFDLYREAMADASERYVLGFDVNLIADKMLDNFNRYRRTGDPVYLDNARKYAAIIKVDQAGFPSLWKLRRRPKPVIL